MRKTWWWPHPSHPQRGTAYLSTERKAAWEPLDSEQKWSEDSELGGGGPWGSEQRPKVLLREVSAGSPRSQPYQGAPHRSIWSCVTLQPLRFSLGPRHPHRRWAWQSLSLPSPLSHRAACPHQPSLGVPGNFLHLS